MRFKKAAILLQQSNLTLQQAQLLRLIELRQQQILRQGDGGTFMHKLRDQLDSGQSPINITDRIKPDFRLIVGRKMNFHFNARICGDGDIV